MSLGPRLVHICLLAEGFPVNISAAEVVRSFNNTTKASVTRIAPLERGSSETSSGWLLLLQSHDDQVRCLMNHKTFEFCHGSENYKISLNYPNITLTPQDFNWVLAEEEEEGQMDSVASRDMFGGGDEGETHTQMEAMIRNEQAVSGVPESQRLPSQGFQGPQYSTWRDPESHGSGPPEREGPLGHQGPQYSAWRGPQSQGPGPPGLQAPSGPQGLQQSAWRGPESHGPGLQAPSGPQGLQQSAWRGPESHGPGLLGQQQGLSGPQGPQPTAWGSPQSQDPGLQGPSGPQGPQPSTWRGPQSQGPGLQGPSGPQGPQPSAWRGPQSQGPGPPGLQGPSGPQGLQGPSGPQGPQPSAWRGPQAQGPGLQGPSGPQGPQYSTWRGPELHGHQLHALEQKSFPPPSQNQFYPQSDFHPQLYDPCGAKPTVSTAQQEPARLIDLDTQEDSEWSMMDHKQPVFEQTHPAGHGHGSATPGMVQSGSYNTPGHPACHPDSISMLMTSPPPSEQEREQRDPRLEDLNIMLMTSPPSSEQGSDSRNARMEDLNLRQEPFPFVPSSDQEFQAPRDTSMDAFEEKDYQSDFVVLSEATEGDQNFHGHHFHLLVTDLPSSITEWELQEFFQDRRQSGGGPVTKVDLDRSSRSAYIFFADQQVIQRVVQKSPLLLKEKMIDVQMSSTTPQPPKPQIRTVEIRGLKAEEETELCMYYFENPQKGGGDVECYEWNDQEKVFFITFSDPEVAKAVASKGHTVGSKVLEVSLYSPPAEKPEDSQPQCTVEVRSVDPAKTELYEMYFTNPKKGGGTIVDLKLSDDQTVMYITFETPEVAQRVAEMSHKVGGRQLEVIVAPVEEEPTPSCTILVQGYNPGHEELCLYYFENPRHGGGDIVHSVVDEDQKYILMTFENPEVAQDVVARQHRVSGCELDVSLHTPKKASTKRQKSQEPPQEEEQAAAPLRTVVVSAGQRPLESEDTYILYFESPRYGGGDVERVEFDQEKRLVYITFVDPAVAERMAGKQHRITGHMVEARLYVPPKPRPTYPNKLVFQNVADTTTRDCLSMYLEKISGQELQEVLYGEEGGTVLVTFPKEPDFQQILQGTQKRPLEQRFLTVSKVPISNCVVVENMNSQTTEDTVRFYFENKRSQGGLVEKVEMVPEENKCFVYFEDHEVLDRVLSQQHRLDDHQLSVKRYLACLGQSGGSVDPTAFTMPKPLHLHNLDPFKVAFLRQTQTTKAAFFQELSSKYAQGRFEDDTLVINCILTPSVPRARILARTWSTDVQQTVSSYLGLLEVMKYSVVQQLWTEVEQVMNVASMHSPEAATVFAVPEESTVVVVGMKSMAAELHEKVSTFFKAKEEELERRKQEVTETVTNQSSDRLSLLLAMGFPLEAGKRHKGLKIDVQKKKKCIVFHGLLSDVKEAQVEMYQLMETVKTTKISGMTDMQMKLLDSKETKPYIVQKFKGNKIIAVWEFGEQSEISVSAFSDKALVTAVHIIKESVQEHVCQLSQESSQLLQSQKWQTLVSQLKKAQPHGVLLIAPSHDCGQLFITCIDSILHQVVEEVERFIEENTIYSQSVCFSPSRQKLVNMKFKDHLQNIASSLRAHQVQVSMPEPGDKIDIRGTRKGLEEVKRRLELINQVMVCHKEVFEDMSKVKLLTSDCEKDLKMLGRSFQCVLSLRSEDDQLQVLGPDPLASAGGRMQTGGSSEMETSSSVQLPNGVTVSVVVGDITRMKVGAIVNAANDRMDHIGGLARDIVKKGGDIIQKECFDKVRQRGRKLKEGDIIVSGPGSLPCQCIIHAVGPMYKDGKSGEEDCLYDTVMACLQTANDNKLPSIAIPAISTGIFRYPAPEATMVILDAVKKFFDVHRRSTVKSVYLCHLGANIVSLFVKALQKMFPSVPSSPTAYRQPAVRKDTYYTQPPMPAAQGRHTDSVHRMINVSVIPGEIAKQTADVIVNSTSNGLDLHNGAVSSSILKAAGPSLQAECSSKYPGGIQTGGVAYTMGHNLSCREIFHIALCNFSNPSAKQILADAVTRCMSEASRRQFTSLAFPVLGTGNLGFPAPVVAQTMLDAIHQFEQSMPSTSLRDVRIVVYPADRKNLQEFQQALSGMGQRSDPGAQSFVASGTLGRQNRRFSEEPVNQPAHPRPVSTGGGFSSNAAEFDIGGLRLVIKKGDITEEDTDAIVNSTNSYLDLRRGGVAKALRQKCGPQLERELRGKEHDIQQTGIIMTRAYGLNCKYILHVNADMYSRGWEEGIELCFRTAEMKGIKSVAMPALGTGMGLSPSNSAQALFDTLVEKYKHGKQPGMLEEVRVVLFDTKMIPAFVDALQQSGSSYNKASSGFFSRIRSAISGSSVMGVKQTVSNPVVQQAPQQVSLFIYAEKMDDVREVLKAIDEMVKDRFIRREIQDKIITSFDQNHVQRLEQIGEKHKAELQIRRGTGLIIFDGLHKQVFECMQEVSEYIRSVQHEQQEKKTASMLANMVSWCFLEVTTTGTERIEYPPRENQIIETAFQGKEGYAEIKDDGGRVYVIDFNSMMEYPKDDRSSTVSVMRRDKLKDQAGGQVPDFWEPHSSNETVKLVTLKATDPEYQQVSSGFTASVRNVSVTNIQRVQNTHLYHQYMAKKAHLEKQNPGIENEKVLWHGTSADALTNINHHGFNRSFCGKNATVHGQGVYFAINASYSASPTYSPPDVVGNRYIYQCKVLVGHPTNGHTNLRVLPARQGPILYDSATDNPNSPSIYVIFNDTQAYPEYMITFK